MKNFNEKYTIRDFIDKTKWANIYQAIKNDTNEKVIISVLINVEGHEENLENFKEEINLIKDMDNSNLTSINGICTYTDKDKIHYYIENEYFEGLTLKELKKCSDIDETKSLEIIREVIKGIREFNIRHLNYGNLTEEDIIINEKGIVKVNVLSFINKQNGHLECKSINDSNFDYYKDIYLIGSILSELITGKYDFHSNEELDIDLVEILSKSTNKKHLSKHKYKKIDEFLDDIILYLDEGDRSYKNIVNFENIKHLQNNHNTKKIISVVICVLLIISGVGFGGKYILNNINQNKTNSYASNDIQAENKEKDDASNNEEKEQNNSNKVDTVSNLNKINKTQKSPQQDKNIQQETQHNTNQEETTKENNENNNVEDNTNKDNENKDSENKDSQDKDNTDKDNTDKDNENKNNENKDSQDKDNTNKDNENKEEQIKEEDSDKNDKKEEDDSSKENNNNSQSDKTDTDKDKKPSEDKEEKPSEDKEEKPSEYKEEKPSTVNTDKDNSNNQSKDNQTDNQTNNDKIPEVNNDNSKVNNINSNEENEDNSDSENENNMEIKSLEE